MPNLNITHLIGNLTRDPEMRATPKGTAICQFGLAINRKFRDESGADREEVLFVDVEAWGKTAETIAKYCTKGKPLYVQGRLKLDQWEDKNTKEKRSRIKVVCDQFQFLGGNEQRGESPRPAQAQAPKAAAPANAPELDEDVPF